MPAWQRDLTVANDRVGVVLADQDKFDEALASYRASLAISERLTAADPSNAQWQHGLSVTHERIGDVLAFQQKFEEALASYRASLAIRARLAASDRSDAGWQRDVAILHGRLAVLYQALGKTADVMAELAKAEDHGRARRLSPSHAGWKTTLAWFDSQIGGQERPTARRGIDCD